MDQDTPVTVNTDAAAPGMGTSTISGLSNTTHLFQIRIQSAGSAGIALEGLDARSGSPGVLVHNLGSAGSSTQNWVGVDAGLWEAQLATLHPTLAVIMLSPNDQYYSISAADQSANLSALIERIRVAAPGVPIMLVPPPDNGLNRLPAMADYNSSQQALAAARDVSYVDVLDPMQPFNPVWFNADLLHPNADGGLLIADIVMKGMNLDLPPPVVTITPASSSIDQSQGLPVTITVNGSPAPTGTVQLWGGGSYASGALTLSGGSTSLQIPGGSLPRGNDNLVAVYSPDTASAATYMSAMRMVVETVTSPAPLPVFSLPGGTYTSVQTVTISDSAANTAIYYTIDGSTPTASSILYSGPITVSSSETLQAIASGNGYSNSSVAKASYVINLPAAAAPVFSLAGGAYSSVQTVSLTDVTPGAAIYYTTDATLPTNASTLYSEPITISSTETIEAIALASGYVFPPPWHPPNSQSNFRRLRSRSPART